MSSDNRLSNPRPSKRPRTESSAIDFFLDVISCWNDRQPTSGSGDQGSLPNPALTGSVTPPAETTTNTPTNPTPTTFGRDRRDNGFAGFMWNPPSSNNNDDDDERPDPSVTFATCGGVDEQINYIKKYVLRIMENQSQFEAWGIDPVKGIIFHGPPGSGKTQLAKALANEMKTNDGHRFKFYMRNGSELFGKYVGETEGRIRKLFDLANKNAPAVIFIDELDGISASRDTMDGNLMRFYINVVNQLLGCMDAVVRGKVLVIGATNRLDAIDPAFRRPGRFDRALPFHLPNASARSTILKIHSRRWLNHSSDADYNEVASHTVGYTGADLEHLCRETIIRSLDRHFPNYTPGQPLDLTQLRVTLPDWHAALAGMNRTNTNVFGLAHFSGELAPPEIRLLTIGNETDISVKIRPWLTQLNQQELGSCVNACLVWSRHRPSLDIINSFVIPSLVSTLDPAEVVAYRLNIVDLLNPTACYQFMAKVLDTTKTKLLIIPHLDDLMEVALSNGVWFPLTLELSRLRGTRVLLLATASAPKDDIRSTEIQSLLATAEEVKVRTLSTPEAKAYFEPVFTPQFYCENQRKFATDLILDATAVNLLTTGLAPLLAKAIDFACRHQISDALDMKNALRRTVSCQVTPSQHLENLKCVLSDYDINSSDHRSMYS